MSNCSTTNYFSGYGNVLIASRASNGALSSGYTHLGDTEAFDINMSQTYIDEFASCDSARSKVAHLPDTTEYSVNINAKSFSTANIAKATQGTVTAVTGSTVTGEALSVYAVGETYPLAHPGVSSVAIKKGVTTLTAGTDYTLNADHGTITVLSLTNMGSPSGGVYSITADYTYANSTRVEGVVTGQKEYALRFEGYNRADGKKVVIDIWRVSLNLAQVINLIQNGAFGRLAMTGEALIDSTITGSGLSQVFRYVETA